MGRGSDGVDGVPEKCGELLTEVCFGGEIRGKESGEVHGAAQALAHSPQDVLYFGGIGIGVQQPVTEDQVCKVPGAFWKGFCGCGEHGVSGLDEIGFGGGDEFVPALVEEGVAVDIEHQTAIAPLGGRQEGFCVAGEGVAVAEGVGGAVGADAGFYGGAVGEGVYSTAGKVAEELPQGLVWTAGAEDEVAEDVHGRPAR